MKGNHAYLEGGRRAHPLSNPYVYATLDPCEKRTLLYVFYNWCWAYYRVWVGREL